MAAPSATYWSGITPGEASTPRICAHAHTFRRHAGGWWNLPLLMDALKLLKFENSITKIDEFKMYTGATASRQKANICVCRWLREILAPRLIFPMRLVASGLAADHGGSVLQMTFYSGNQACHRTGCVGMATVLSDNTLIKHRTTEPFFGVWRISSSRVGLCNLDRTCPEDTPECGRMTSNSQ